MTNELILKVVSETLGIPMEVLKSKTRKREVLDVRGICVLLIKQFKMVQNDQLVADMFGQNRTSIIHTRNTYTDLLDTSKSVKNKYEQCLKALTDYTNESLNSIPQY